MLENDDMLCQFIKLTKEGMKEEPGKTRQSNPSGIWKVCS